MLPFEDDNLKAYKLLLRIEIALRELIKISMENEYGSQWRKRLPGDLLTKIRESQREENRSQFGYLCLGPLYYLTFGELKDILQQKTCSVTEQLGGKRFIGQLDNVMPPRNAVCHSRAVSAIGLQAIELLYATIEAALTPEKLEKIVSNPDTGLFQHQVANELIPALEAVIRDMSKHPRSFTVPVGFEAAKTQFWWADESLAGFNIKIVESAFDLIRKYNDLPTGVGCAVLRLKFCEDKNLVQVIQDAITELEKVKT